MSSTFYPANSGRVSSQQSLTRLMFQIHNDQGAIQKLQTQLSTGQRIERPSEDPAAAIRALVVQRTLEFKGQITANLRSANSVLGASEATLSEAQAILNDVRGLAVESSGNVLSEGERKANSAQIRAAIQKLVDIGNTRFRDQYVFAGSDVLRPPLTLNGNSVRFSGVDGLLNTVTDTGTTIAANVTADETFGTRSDRVVGTVDLNAALLPSTQLSELNAGAGVRAGSITLSDGSLTIEVDLTRVHTIQDVVNAVQAQQLGGRDLQVTVGTSGLTVDYADGLGGTMLIGEVGAGKAATDLGIRTNGLISSAPIVGTDLDPITTPLTQLSQLLGGSGIPDGSVFKLTQNNKDYLVDTTGMQTVEDLINGIEASGARVRAELDPSGKRFAIYSLESGTTLSIGEAGGTLAADLGVRTLAASTSLSQLNFGQGINSDSSNQQMSILRTDGTEMIVDLSGAQTVGDVLTRINSHADNTDPALLITASLATNGNGIVLSAPTGAQALRIANVGGSKAAWGLGLVPQGESAATGTTVGTNSVISGIDVSGVEVEGAFTTLLRLEDAIARGDTAVMERLTAALDSDIQRLGLSRSIVGSRQQTISQLQWRTDEQQIQLKEIESQEIEVDLAQVISDLVSRQSALQASLQLMGQSTKVSLFDFL